MLTEASWTAVPATGIPSEEKLVERAHAGERKEKRNTHLIQARC
jgi:hypothetical protein